MQLHLLLVQPCLGLQNLSEAVQKTHRESAPLHHQLRTDVEEHLVVLTRASTTATVRNAANADLGVDQLKYASVHQETSVSVLGQTSDEVGVW